MKKLEHVLLREKEVKTTENKMERLVPTRLSRRSLTGRHGVEKSSVTPAVFI